MQNFDVFSEFDKERIRGVNQGPLLFDDNYLNTKNRRCPFYNSTKNICAIYDQRPLDRRLYSYAYFRKRNIVICFIPV
ncbi:MAG: YkgJ family cysteine cluster protein [Candidatus Paceibacterota bacterium]